MTSMMNKLPISVHILTWNSAQTLERAMASVESCAEILVIDGGSQDDTVTIAERCGARVIPQRFPGAQGKPLMDFSAARNAGLEHATQPWILALDSDEVMSPDAMKEISAIVTKPQSQPDPEPAPALPTVADPAPSRAEGAGAEAGAYRVPRRYVTPDGTVITLASTYPNERIYFFRKDATERWEKPVHERIALKPETKTGRLKDGSLAPLAPLSVFRSKLGQYLKIECEQSRGKGWLAWFRRVIHTLRGRAVSFLRLLWIWLIPHQGERLPLRYEMARFWYGWKLVVMTCPAFL